MTKPVFKPIDGEKYRTYLFAKDGGFYKITINEPEQLNVSESGGHRVIDAKGISHYIPTGWIHLYWETKPGYDKFPY